MNGLVYESLVVILRLVGVTPGFACRVYIAPVISVHLNKQLSHVGRRYFSKGWLLGTYCVTPKISLPKVVVGHACHITSLVEYECRQPYGMTL